MSNLAEEAIEARRAAAEGNGAAAPGDAATVREATYDLLRAHGMTTMFGNPGSTELPFLKDFPSDFTYVLALQEAVAVGMADGWAQASRKPAFVNLHTTPGVGHGMGSIINARDNRTPMVVTAGQQSRPMMALGALLTNNDATTLPKPAVKWSYEPARAEDVPMAVARGIHLAGLHPRGPVFLSLPMDDWEAEPQEYGGELFTRQVSGRFAPDPEVVAQIAVKLEAASNPVLVLGGEVDTSGGWDAAVRLAEKQRLPVFAAAIEGRAGFPEDHPNFQGVLPPALGAVGQFLEGRDLIVVAGAPVFKYYPNIPGPMIPEGSEVWHITSDPDEAARAQVGNAAVGDAAAFLEAIVEKVGESDRDQPPPRAEMPPPEDSDPIAAGSAFDVLADVIGGDEIIVNESPSNALAFRTRIKTSRPGSFMFGAGGGLGFGLSAAVGAQIGAPDRPVVAVLGEGSAQYTITALWTAVAYRVPLTILVLRNDEYAILKWFSDLEQVEGAPGLDLPGLDCVALARAYGMRADRVEGVDALRDALAEGIGASEPRLIEVQIAPGMSV
ncbi:MAG: benzoylformate decarboxylase [Thermoleophilaceae bacterium]|nr:benzoylformate decarboxylase [Thermoleophilaceae bacterium]